MGRNTVRGTAHGMLCMGSSAPRSSGTKLKLSSPASSGNFVLKISASVAITSA